MEFSALLEAAKSGLSGADLRYFDLRHEETAHEHFVTRDRTPENGAAQDAGVGIRVLAGTPGGASGWGFASTNRLDPASVRACAERAARTARASALCPGEPFEYVPSAARGEYRSTVEIDPFAMPRAQKEDYARDLEARLEAPERVSSRVSLQFIRVRRRFANSAGADTFQELVYNGVSSSITLHANGRSQSRGFPGALGNFRQGGFEVVRGYRIEERIPALLEEAREILEAPECPSEVADVVLGPEMLGLVVHEVCGHAAEFDRVLGDEAAYAGKSFVTPDLLGNLVYGSPLVNLVSDPTFPGTAGSYGFDEEGTPARAVDLVRDGIWTGYLTGRENAPRIGAESASACRAARYDRMPINRITSVNLLPGDRHTRDEVIGLVERGYYLDDFCGWSINSDRNGFRFSVEEFREIRDGRLGRRFRGGSFRARTTPEFWGGCFAVAKDPPYVAGYNSCAKGQPVQILMVGHVVPRAVAFHGVKVGK